MLNPVVGKFTVGFKRLKKNTPKYVQKRHKEPVSHYI